jgi:hypothetical protein
MSTIFTVGLNNGASNIKRLIIQLVNMRGTKMVMDFVKFIRIRWRAFGRYYVLGSDHIVVFHKISYRYILAFLNLFIMLESAVRLYFPLL